MLIFGINYATDVVLNQVALSNRSLIALYVQQIDQYLGEADNYLYSIIAKDTDLTIMDVPGTSRSRDYHMAKIRLNNKLTTDIVNYRHIDAFFVYSSTNDDLLTTGNREGTYEKFQAVRTDIREMFRDSDTLEAECLKLWCVRNLANHHYLVRVAKIANVYIGAWINVEKLMIPMQLVNFGKTGSAVLTSSEFEPIANREYIRDKDIDLRVSQASYVLSGHKGKYLVVGVQSNASDYYLFAGRRGTFPDFFPDHAAPDSAGVRHLRHH
jgi:two-component system sensor histidine kinase YesM